jgi:hypothetical protein
MASSAIEYAGKPGLVTPGKITKPPFQVKIDTLTLICRNVCTGKGRDDIIALTEAAFGETIEFDEMRGTHSGKYWRGSTVRSMKGTRVLWNPGSEDAFSSGEVSIHLTGTVLQGVSLFELLDYLDVLMSYGADMTELHVALDDLDKFVPLMLIEQAVDDGNISGAHDGVALRGLGRKRGHNTINIGSPESDKRLTAYAKDKESGDDYYGNRWEAKFRRQYAQQVFHKMFECETPEALAVYLSGVVLGCVRFVDKTSGDHHVDRLPALAWYEELCSRVAPAVKISPLKKKVTLRDSVDWVERQVLRRLGMIKKAMGQRFHSWLDESMSDKTFNLSPVDVAMIEEYQEYEQQQQQQSEEKRKEKQQQQSVERLKTLKLRPMNDHAIAERHRIEMNRRWLKDQGKNAFTRRILDSWDKNRTHRISPGYTEP